MNALQIHGLISQLLVPSFVINFTKSYAEILTSIIIHPRRRICKPLDTDSMFKDEALVTIHKGLESS